MAWSVTQGLAATPTQATLAGGATSTRAITPTAVGSLLFITGGITSNVSGAQSAIASVSDNVDGAWTVIQVNTGFTAGSAAATTSFIAWRDNASSTASRTITVTNGVNNASLTWAPGEATHSGITFASDGNASIGTGNTTANTTVTVTGPTPSLANGLAIAVGNNDSGSAWTAPTGGIWSVLWSLTASGAGTDGRAVIGTNPAVGSAMSTTFTETGGNSVVPSAIVVVFKGPAAGTPQGGRCIYVLP